MCAIFGVFNVLNAASSAAIGLHNNQHRAINFAGIASFENDGFHIKQGTGLVRHVFTREVLAKLPGQSALGHIRYPTVADDERFVNIQPIVGKYGEFPFALAHNGNITNVDSLRNLINPVRMTTSIDSEFIVRLLEDRYTGNIEADLAAVMKLLEGSISLGILLPDRLIAVRDKSGNRPLSLAKLEEGYCISSESCAFPNVGAAVEYQDIKPGTMVSITRDGHVTWEFAQPAEQKCRFEGIYYSHPGSAVFGESVSAFRQKLGRALLQHCPIQGPADIVTPVPDSSTHIAMGYGTGNSGTYFPVITRSHYVGRTFIESTQAKREMEVAQKFAFDAQQIKGRHIVVVDDSIVRGTTLPVIIRMLRTLGARSVHVRIGSPPIKYSCRYGINTPTQAELISASKTSAQIREFVGADSLEFLPLETLRELSPDPQSFCFACMDGSYW